MTRRLAIDGGVPSFARPLHVGEPNIADEAAFLRRVADILERKRFTNNGPNVEQLEAAVANRLGVEQCIAVANATLGLQLLLTALGRRGEVVIPAWTFVATPHAARFQGLDVRFVDAHETTHTLDVDHLSRIINHNTAAVLGVHLFGQPCATEAIEQIAGPLGVPVIFDAAHSLGVSCGGKAIGGFGLAEVFSLHATKFIHGFEGGLITTNSSGLADDLRLMRNFGFSGRDRVELLGTNAKLSEIHAAMALTQFNDIDHLADMNAERHRVYTASLRELPGVDVFQPDADTRNDQYVVVNVDAALAGISRDELIDVLDAEGVLARRYFAPGCHRQRPYVDEQPGASRWLPNTERLAETTLVLPTGPNLRIEDVETIGGIIGAAIEQSEASSRRRHKLLATT